VSFAKTGTANFYPALRPTPGSPHLNQPAALSRLRGGDYVKIDGVYVGRHPFELEPSALTLFGCNLLQVTSNDADVPR